MLFNSDIVSSVSKSDKVKVESSILLIFVLWGWFESNLLFIASDKIPECDESISPSSLYGSGVD